MPKNQKKSWLIIILFLYLIFVNLILPLLSLLRVMRLSEPAAVRNIVLIITIFALATTVGFFRVLRPYIWSQIILIFVFLQAIFVGLAHLLQDGGLSAYFSHLFQIASFYIMLGIGWYAVDQISNNFWRHASWLAMVGVGLATALIIFLMVTVGVARFYTPAYQLLLPISFYTGNSLLGTLSALLLVLSSNKRSVLIASIFMLIMYFLFKKSIIYQTKFRPTKWLYSGLIFAAIMLGSSFYLTGSEKQSQFDELPVIRAINITLNRMIGFNSDAKNLDALNSYSSSRIEETQLALDSLQWYTWLVGNGAGWSINLGYVGADIHNIHVTPISLLMVYGAPFTIFIYTFLATLTLKLYLNRKKLRDNTTAKVGFLYLIGAVIHSFMAYSLFIDLLIPFFVGTSLKILKNIKAKPLFLFHNR